MSPLAKEKSSRFGEGEKKVKTEKREEERKKKSLEEGERPSVKATQRRVCYFWHDNFNFSRRYSHLPIYAFFFREREERKYLFSLNNTSSFPKNATSNRTPSSCDQHSYLLRSDASRLQTSPARVWSDRVNTALSLASLRLARRIAAKSCPTSHSSISNSKGSTPRTFHRRQGSTPSTTTKKNFNTSVYLVKYPPRLRCIALSYRRSAVLRRFCPWKRRRKWICKTDGSDG